MPRFYAIFKVVTEKHVLVDADNYQDAARKIRAMKAPVLSEEASLDGVGTVFDDTIEEEDVCYYDVCHDLMGTCNKCGFEIVDGCSYKGGSEVCDAQHTGPGGWTSTEHGHVIWCSQACRDADKANDPEVEPLDRMASID